MSGSSDTASTQLTSFAGLTPITREPDVADRRAGTRLRVPAKGTAATPASSERRDSFIGDHIPGEPRLPMSSIRPATAWRIREADRAQPLRHRESGMNTQTAYFASVHAADRCTLSMREPHPAEESSVIARTPYLLTLHRLGA